MGSGQFISKSAESDAICDKTDQEHDGLVSFGLFATG